jgi:hypothetical protein
MKYVKVVQQILLTTLLIVLSGCTPMIEWGKKAFYQGELIELDIDVVRSYIRSISAYDQFSTIARFDALWLSPEVRKIYTELLVRTTGQSEDQKKVVLIRQQDEMKHFIMFYILSPYNITLGEANSYWTLFLSVDGISYHPIEIKVIELNQIYRAFFGERQMRFCISYQVKFDALTIENKPIINEQTKEIILYFRSLDKELTLQWCLNSFVEGENIILPPKDISAEQTNKN